MDYWRTKLLELIDTGIDRAKKMEQADNVTKERVGNLFENGMQPIKDAALRAALENVGLHVEGTVDQYSITKAINAGPLAGTGIEFTNIFDKLALRASLERIAIRKVAESMGMQADTINELKNAVVEHYLPDIAAQLKVGEGPMVDGAPPDRRIVQAIAAAVKNENWNTPVDFSKAGINNRERQARYRRGKSRHWVER